MSTYTHDRQTGVVTQTTFAALRDYDLEVITMFTVEVLKNDKPLPPRIEQERPELKLI